MNPYHIYSKFKAEFVALSLIVSTLFSAQAYSEQVRILDNGLACGSECNPDFASATSTALNLEFRITGNIGTLSYTASAGEVTLHEDDLQNPDASGANGLTGYSVNPMAVAGDNIYNISFSFDVTSLVASSNPLGGFQASSGLVDINGRVRRDNFQTVLTTSGLSLLGDLLTTDVYAFGYQDDSISGGNTGTSFKIDFLGDVDDTNSLISEIFGLTAYGIINVSALEGEGGAYNYNQKWYQQEWNARAVADVMVPVPSAFLLFATALVSLMTLRTRKNS